MSKARERIYLPMSNRDAGYCVTSIEQRDIARKHGLPDEKVRSVLLAMIGTMEPQKTANKTKALIDAAMRSPFV